MSSPSHPSSTRAILMRSFQGINNRASPARIHRNLSPSSSKTPWPSKCRSLTSRRYSGKHCGAYRERTQVTMMMKTRRMMKGQKAKRRRRRMTMTTKMKSRRSSRRAHHHHRLHRPTALNKIKAEGKGEEEKEKERKRDPWSAWREQV